MAFVGGAAFALTVIGDQLLSRRSPDRKPVLVRVNAIFGSAAAVAVLLPVAVRHLSSPLLHAETVADGYVAVLFVVLDVVILGIRPDTEASGDTSHDWGASPSP